jgi:demethylmenaquinone methyltransferase/2-methoxy-6-polyprenyl-1,4-benzoquinol methylase
MKKGGHVAILEFSKPDTFPFKNMYNIYFRYILPGFGKMISKHKKAYAYLPQSVEQFYEGDDFLKEMEKAGFSAIDQKRLTFGIATLYTGTK